jgi:hypothetical protein
MENLMGMFNNPAMMEQMNQMMQNPEMQKMMGDPNIMKNFSGMMDPNNNENSTENATNDENDSTLNDIEIQTNDNDENIISNGSSVLLQNLKNNDYNNLTAIVQTYNPEKERYLIELTDSNKIISVKRDNVILDIE